MLNLNIFQIVYPNSLVSQINKKKTKFANSNLVQYLIELVLSFVSHLLSDKHKVMFVPDSY